MNNYNMDPKVLNKHFEKETFKKQKLQLFFFCYLL